MTFIVARFCIFGCAMLRFCQETAAMLLQIGGRQRFRTLRGGHAAGYPWIVEGSLARCEFVDSVADEGKRRGALLKPISRNAGGPHLRSPLKVAAPIRRTVLAAHLGCAGNNPT